MKPDTEKRKVTPSFLLWIGIFFLYLAISIGDINGDSIVLALIGVGCLGASILLCPPVSRYLLKQAGIVEVDLEKQKQDEDFK